MAVVLTFLAGMPLAGHGSGCLAGSVARVTAKASRTGAASWPAWNRWAILVHARFRPRARDAEFDAPHTVASPGFTIIQCEPRSTDVELAESLIAGAPRCGTSSLDAYFQAVPGIYMCRIKEPNFFSRVVIADDHPMVSPIRDERRYLDLFAAAGEARYRGEASPNYLEDPKRRCSSSGWRPARR